MIELTGDMAVSDTMDWIPKYILWDRIQNNLKVIYGCKATKSQHKEKTHHKMTNIPKNEQLWTLWLKVSDKATLSPFIVIPIST